MKCRRGLALLTGLVMLLSMLPVAVSANEGLIGTEKAKLELVYMQYKEGYSDSNVDAGTGCKVEEASIPESFVGGEEVLVGVKISDISNISEASQGMYSFVAGVVYNDTYLTAESIGDYTYNSQNRIGSSSDTLFYRNNYTYNTSGMGDNVNPDGSGRVRGVYVRYKNATDNPSYIGDSEQYLAVLKFTVKSPVPVEGAKVFDFSINNTVCTTSFGRAGTIGYAAQQGGSLEFLSVIEMDVSGANIFPSTFTLKYHDNAGDGVTVIDGTSVEGNTSQKVGEYSTIAEAYESAEGSKDGKLISNPRANGYVVTGWYLDADCSADKKFDENTIVTYDLVQDAEKEPTTINLYAQWEPGYAIGVDPNGGKFADGSTTAFIKELGNSQTPADVISEFPAQPTRDNYVFKEWNNAANGTGENSYATLSTSCFTQGETAILYAQWDVDPTLPDEEKVTVTFDSNEATTEAAPTSKTIKKGDSLGSAMPNNPVKTNYKFMGWNSKQNGTGDAFDGNTSVTASQTVYAQWEGDPDVTEPKNVTVTFTATEADVVDQPDPTSKTIKAGDSIGEGNMPNVPTRPNYMFSKWVNTVGETDFDGTTTVTADTTVKAVWDDAVNISFYANDGTGAGTTPAAVVPAAMNKAFPANKIPKLTRDDGYVLSGWNTDPNGTGTDLDSSYTVSGAASFYAVWQAAKDDDGDGVPNDPIEADTDAIQVNFNVNCADTDAVAKPATRYLKNGHTSLSQIPTTGMPTATRDKYTLKGWYATPGGTGAAVLHTTDLTPFVKTVDNKKIVNLYAQWEVDDDQLAADDVKVIVRMHQRRGITDTLQPTYTVVAGEALGFALDVPVRGGFTHEGWVDANDADFLPLTTAIPAGTAAEDGNHYFDVYATWGASISVTLSDLTKTFNGERQGATVVSFVGDDGVTINANDFVEGTDYLISYSVPSGDPVVDEDDNPIKPIDAGTYDIDFILLNDESEDNGVTGITINDCQPSNEFTIQKAEATFALAEGASQSVKISDTDKTLALTATATLAKSTGDETKTLTQNTEFKVQYAPLNEDGTWTGITTWLDTAPAAIGDYVAKIVILDENYAIGGLDQSIQYYGEAGSDVAERIKFKVTPDIELNGFAIVGSDAENFEAPKTLYDNTFTNAITFDEDTNLYYVTAGVGENIKIQFDGTFGADTEITITRNDAAPEAITTTVVDGKPTTGEITLAPANGTNNGISNTITVNLSGTDDGPIYTIYVRQLAEAKITLAYGNSPYGEIMKSDLADKDEAKAQFNANNRFVEGYVPASATAIAEKGYAYSTRAWVTTESSTSFTEDELARVEDPTINMDRDDKAIFIYNEKAFIDPGFTATNSLGERVELLDRKITVSRVSEDNYVGLNDETQEADEIVIAGKGVDYVISEITPKYVAGGTRIVRPDKYEMVYSFKDPVLVDDPSTADIDESVVTVKRNVVILSPMGDTDLSGAVNGNDSNFIDAYVATLGNIASLKQVKESAYRIFLFRTADTDTTNTINGNDSNAIDSAVATLRQPLQLYVELPSEAIAPEPTE